ncbi:hypothetical protein ACEWY4_015256 [Coilia grayii]|uniref:Uncharacterized protein n=1 Tax=Coilia grayii TaxID=363190 RepID=A0ABD1JML3_9TELE
MITIQAIAWNERKRENLHHYMSQRYCKTLQKTAEVVKQLEHVIQAIGEQQVAGYVEDVRQWAENASHTNSPLQEKIETTFLSIKQRKLDLYRQNDTNKLRGRIRKKIQEELASLKDLVMRYNSTPLVEHINTDGVMANLDINTQDVQLWPWSGGDRGNLLQKKKIFDLAMSRQRLVEEKSILEAEMAQHSASLKVESEALANIIAQHSCTGSCSHLCYFRQRLAKVKKEAEVVFETYTHIPTYPHAQTEDETDNEEDTDTEDDEASDEE